MTPEKEKEDDIKDLLNAIYQIPSPVILGGCMKTLIDQHNEHKKDRELLLSRLKEEGKLFQRCANNKMDMTYKQFCDFIDRFGGCGDD